jgi:hypothetical protein
VSSRGTGRHGVNGGKLNPTDCLDLDVEDLAAAVDTGLGIHAVRAERATVGVLGKLRGAERVGGAAIGAAALGLFAFRIGHKKKVRSAVGRETRCLLVI